jgi:hypothetical protein
VDDDDGDIDEEGGVDETISHAVLPITFLTNNVIFEFPTLSSGHSTADMIEFLFWMKWWEISVTLTQSPIECNLFKENSNSPPLAEGIVDEVLIFLLLTKDETVEFGWDSGGVGWSFPKSKGGSTVWGSFSDRELINCLKASVAALEILVNEAWDDTYGPWGSGNWR